MKPRLVGAVVIGLLAALVILSINQWLEQSAVERVVGRFLQAVIDGDEATALACLEHPRQAQPMVPEDDVAFRIVAVRISGRTAIVETRVERDDARIHPEFHMVHNASGEWKIQRITKLSSELFFTLTGKEQALQDGRETAQEIADQLQRDLDRPVEVDFSSDENPAF